MTKEIKDRTNEQFCIVPPTDLRVDPPVEPQFLPLTTREAALESLRENIGLLKFSSDAIQRAYFEMYQALEKAKAGDEVNWENVVRYLLLKTDGIIHVTVTLSTELDEIWRHLKAHLMWEFLEEERKRLRMEKIREARRKKKESQKEN